MNKEKVFYDESAERLLLGSMLNDNKCICDVISKLQPSMFFSPIHKVIYETICKLYKAGITVDICSLNTELTSLGLITSAGGTGYIASLTNEIYSSANFSYYLNIIKKNAQSRALKTTLLKNLENVGVTENQQIISNLENDIFKISASTTQTKIWTSEELAADFNEYIKYNEETYGEEKGIKVGFPTLDRMTDGFQSEDLIIIGARPSIGKTAFAISMMQNLLKKNIPFGFVSAEMSQNQIMIRMISQRTKLDSSTIRNGPYTNEVKSKIYEANAFFSSRKFFIDDTPNINLNALISSVRHMKYHCGIRIVFIDYLGLIAVEGNGPVWEKVSDISKSLKTLARELKIPIIALSQLGRDAEGNSPSISNIRGSGSVEQDADLVILLNGERDLSCYKDPNPILERELILAKHRNGPCGKVYLNFEKQFTLFSEDSDQEKRASQEAN